VSATRKLVGATPCSSLYPSWFSGGLRFNEVHIARPYIWSPLEYAEVDPAPPHISTPPRGVTTGVFAPLMLRRAAFDKVIMVPR
jgi:hypothetical protein